MNLASKILHSWCNKMWQLYHNSPSFKNMENKPVSFVSIFWCWHPNVELVKLKLFLLDQLGYPVRWGKYYHGVKLIKKWWNGMISDWRKRNGKKYDCFSVLSMVVMICSAANFIWTNIDYQMHMTTATDQHEKYGQHETFICRKD